MDLVTGNKEASSASSQEIKTILDLNCNKICVRRPFEVESPPNKDLPKPPPEAEGPFKCAHCGLKFVHDYQLWWHWRDHIPRQERHLCHLCPFVSKTASSLQQHIHRSHEILNGGVACHVCQGAFIAKDRYDLSRHVFRSHMFDRRFYLRPLFFHQNLLNKVSI